MWCSCVMRSKYWAYRRFFYCFVWYWNGSRKIVEVIMLQHVWSKCLWIHISWPYDAATQSRRRQNCLHESTKSFKCVLVCVNRLHLWGSCCSWRRFWCLHCKPDYSIETISVWRFFLFNVLTTCLAVIHHHRITSYTLLRRRLACCWKKHKLDMQNSIAVRSIVAAAVV